MGNASWSEATRSSGHRPTLNDCMIRTIQRIRHRPQKTRLERAVERQNIEPIMPIVPDQSKNRTQVLLQIRGGRWRRCWWLRRNLLWFSSLGMDVVTAVVTRALNLEDPLVWDFPIIIS